MEQKKLLVGNALSCDYFTDQMLVPSMLLLSCMRCGFGCFCGGIDNSSSHIFSLVLWSLFILSVCASFILFLKPKVLLRALRSFDATLFVKAEESKIQSTVVPDINSFYKCLYADTTLFLFL